MPEYLATALLIRAVYAYHSPVAGTSVLALSRQAMAAVRELVLSKPKADAIAGPSTPPRASAATKAKSRAAASGDEDAP
jgi:hypothetical protein